MSTPPLTNTVYIPYEKNSVASYLSKNKTPLLIGLTVGVLLSAPIFTTAGAAIYHLITEAASVHCSPDHALWRWETTTLP